MEPEEVKIHEIEKHLINTTGEEFLPVDDIIYNYKIKIKNILKRLYQDLDANNNQLKNLKKGSDPNDAVTLEQLDKLEGNAFLDISPDVDNTTYQFSLSKLLYRDNVRATPEGSKGQYLYRGERVDLKTVSQNEYGYNASKLLTINGLGGYNGNSAQGMAIYGEVAFVFYDKGFCRTIDLENKSEISVFPLDSGANNVNNHAGQANFGYEFYQQNDEFPMLYLSSYLENKVYVFRMTRTSSQLIQTIYMTDGTRFNNKYVLLNMEAIFVDNENKKFITKMGAVDPDNVKYKSYKVFDYVSFREGAEVFLFEEQKNDSFFLPVLNRNAVPDNKNFPNAGFAKDGKIYVLFGFQGNYSHLMIYDYFNHRIFTKIKWQGSLLTGNEQEQCYYYKNKLIINYNGADYLIQVDFV